MSTNNKAQVNNRVYLPRLNKLDSITNIVKLHYNEQYISNNLLQQLIDSKHNTYVLKHMGAGFTYGILGVKANIVIAVPNIKIVKDKEQYKHRFGNANLLFLYGGSKDKKSTIKHRKLLGNLIIMCTIDQFTMIHHQVDHFTWIFDETHTVSVGAGYRDRLAQLEPLIKNRVDRTIQVTATPPLTIPDMYSNYKFVQFINRGYTPLKIDITYNVPKAIEDIRSNINKGNTIAIFSNKRDNLTKFLGAGVTEATVGDKMRLQLTQFDNTGKLFEDKNNTKIYLHTSAGVEGKDIFNNGDTHTYVFCDLSHPATTYTITSMVQAIGRARNGNTSITWIIENHKDHNTYKNISLEALKVKYVNYANELKKIGSTGILESNKSKVIEYNGEFMANVFGIHGEADKHITKQLLSTQNYNKIEEVLKVYGCDINSFDKEVKKVGSDKKTPIRDRINNSKLIGLDSCTKSYDNLYNYYYPLSLITASDTELKVYLCAIYELEFNTIIDINTTSPHIDRYINKMEVGNIELMNIQHRSPLNIINNSVALHRKFKTQFKRGNTIPDLDILKEFWEWLSNESFTNKRKWLSSWGFKDIDSLIVEINKSNFNIEFAFTFFKASAKTYNKTLFKNARLYLKMYAFGVLNRDNGLVKNRSYPPHVSLNMEQISAITHGHIIEIDITSAYPQFIDKILGSNVGLRAYNNLMDHYHITRKKAKVMYNVALNKSDIHKRDKRTTINIFKASGYTLEESNKLYDHTRVKGEIYLKLVLQEKKAIDKMVELAGEIPMDINLTRRHDSILIIGTSPYYLNIIAGDILENYKGVQIHYTLYNFNTYDKVLINKELEKKAFVCLKT